MKGVVFSLKKNNFGRNRLGRISVADIRYFIRRYGVRTMFVFLLFAGIAIGSVYAKNADASMIESLDFLFTTNFDARLTQNFAGIFCACLASDFIFLISVYLLGLAPWGIPFMLFIIFFKGFGIGLTAGYLFIGKSLAGIGFYLLILLPGTFLFCMALVQFSSFAFNFSKRMFLTLLNKGVLKSSLRVSTIAFSSRFISSLIITFLSAVLDTALWTLFAGGFNF